MLIYWCMPDNCVQVVLIFFKEIFSTILGLSNLFLRRKKLYHSFSSCNSFKFKKHILGFISKLFKKCNLIMFAMLNIRYFHRSSIIWFIKSLFPKNMLTLLLQWQALLVITEREKCLLSNSSLIQSKDLWENKKF